MRYKEVADGFRVKEDKLVKVREGSMEGPLELEGINLLCDSF